MSDPVGAPPESGQRVRLLLDASAVLAYGRSAHVGETIVSLGDEAGFARFGVSPLALAAAWGRTDTSTAADLIVNLTRHPRYVALPVVEHHALRTSNIDLAPGESLQSPWNTWAHLPSPEQTHTVLLALDHECLILTAVPEDYEMPGITVAIPADGADWPEEAASFWPT
jgi:hypothetical protein